MDLQQALLTRRTVHQYVPGPLPDGALDRAFEAAHMAPCHKMTWPWRFIVLGPVTRRAIDQRIVELQLLKRPEDTAHAESVRAKREGPAEHVAVLQALSEDPVRRHEDYAAVSCAIENLMLSLWGEGIGTKWTTSGVRDFGVQSILGLDPSKDDLVGFVFAGHPAKVPSPPRPPVAPLVRRMP